MKKNIFFLSFFLGALLSTAQENWSVSFRPSLHIATRNIYSQPLRLGNGAAVTAAYALNKNVGLYSGFTWNRFDTNENYDEDNIDFTQRGFLAGCMFFFKVTAQQKSPFYARAGISYTAIKSESINDVFNFSADWALGIQFGLGWKLELSKNWFVLPEIQYASTTNSYRVNDVQQDLKLSYISITAGIMYEF